MSLHRNIRSILRNSSRRRMMMTPINPNQNHQAGRCLDKHVWSYFSDSHKDTSSSGSMADSSSNNGTDSQQVFLVQLPNKSSAGVGDRWLWWRERKGQPKIFGDVSCFARPLTWSIFLSSFSQQWQIPATASAATTTFKMPSKSNKWCIHLGWKLVSTIQWRKIQCTKKPKVSTIKTANTWIAIVSHHE